MKQNSHEHINRKSNAQKKVLDRYLNTITEKEVLWRNLFTLRTLLWFLL
jgi:hypothetical protein